MHNIWEGIGNETQFKGAHRGALLISAISATPLEYILPNDKLEKYKTTYFTENDYDDLILRLKENIAY